MKRFLACLLIVLCLLGTTLATAETLRVSGLEKRTILQEGPDTVHDAVARWYTEWKELHPDVKLNAAYKVGFSNTNTLIKGLRKKNAGKDVLVLSSASYDIQALVEAGALLDLSENETLRQMVAQMHPALQETAWHEGRLYAIPCNATFSFLHYDDEVLALAGYSREEMPRSLSELLDFLEAWAIRCETEPVPNVCVTNEFNEETFCAESYTIYLTELFLEQYVQQRAAQGLPCSFDEPALVSMLERIALLGPKLYQAHDPDSTFCLVRRAFSPRDLTSLIPGRLTENDPILIPTQVDMLCIAASSKRQETGLAFAELYMKLLRNRSCDLTRITEEDAQAMLAAALLFTDASDEVVSSSYPWYAEYAETVMTKLKKNAEDKSLSAERREKAARRLKEKELSNWVEEARYQLTREELTAYQSCAEFFRVTTCDLSVISSPAATKFIKQFARGRLSADQLLERLEAQR